MQVNKTKTNDSALSGNCLKPMLENRLLKFRAWSKNINKHFMAIQGELDLETLQSFMFHYSDQPIIMQFTGFKDYNGKEIYEGDIILFTNVRDCTQKKKYQIYFNNECGSWYCENGMELCNILVEQNNDDWKRSQNWTINNNQYVRVIGNIYENSELLNP